MSKKVGCATKEVKLGGKCYPVGKTRYGVTIRSAQRSKDFLIVKGENNAGQRFVEYHKSGKLKGMILKMPDNSFWYVLKGTIIQYEKKKSGREMPIGSRDKTKALAKLKKVL